MFKNLTPKTKKIALSLSALLLISAVLFVFNLPVFNPITPDNSLNELQNIPKTRAQSIIQEVKQDDPEAQIISNTERSITFRLKNGKNRLVAAGKLYTKDNLEIDTEIQPSSDPLFDYETTEGLDYRLKFKEDSTRRYYPRKDINNEYIEIGAPEYLDKGEWKKLPINNPKIEKNRLFFEEPDYTLEYLVTAYGSKVNLILNNPTFNKPIRWKLTLHNLTRNEDEIISNLDKETVASFVKPTWYDSSDMGGDIKYTIEDDYITYSNPDLTGATYPVTIDPTYGPTGVAAGGDDYYHRPSLGTFTITGTDYAWGDTNGSKFHIAMRWDNIGIPVGATISSASIAFRTTTGTTGTGTLLSKIAAVDENDAIAATSDATCNTDDAARTTAQVDWDFTLIDANDNALTTADFSSVVQELADSGFIGTGEAILFQIYDDGNTSKWQSVVTFEHATYTEPTLTIEYSLPRSRLILFLEE